MRINLLKYIGSMISNWGPHINYDRNAKGVGVKKGLKCGLIVYSQIAVGRGLKGSIIGVLLEVWPYGLQETGE